MRTNERSDRTDTKERILRAAERLFAERGILATSLRQIISEAGVNLAAIHYHFQTKEALLEAIVLRRVEVVNDARLARLDVCEAGGRTATPEEIVECFLAPVFDLFERDPAAGRQFARLMGRLYAETDVMPRLLATRFRPMADRFVGALARALPGLPKHELSWRIFFSLGAMAFTLVHGERVAALSNPEEPADLREISWRLTHFLAAGFRAGETEKVL